MRDELRDRTAVVTGATGFLGRHLCERLRQSGADLIAVSRRPQPASAAGMRWWQADPVELGAVRRLLERTRPDLVFHLAGHVWGHRGLEHVVPTFHGNLTSTVNVLTATAELGHGRVILAASLEEPDGTQPENIPSSPYAASKWAASAYGRMFHRLYGLPVVLLRVFMTYGPGQHPDKLIPYVVRSLLAGEPPRLSSGTRPIDWVNVRDVAEAFVAAGAASGVEGQTLDVGSGEAIPVHTIVEKLVALTGSSVTPVFDPGRDRPMEQVRIASIGPTLRLLGWQPGTDLDSGLAEVVAFERGSVRPQSAI